MTLNMCIPAQNLSNKFDLHEVCNGWFCRRLARDLFHTPILQWKWGLKVIIECDKASPSLPTDDTCTHRLIKPQATRKVSNQIDTHRLCHVNVSFPYHLVGLWPWDTTSGFRGGFRFCGWQAGGSHVPNSLRVGGVGNNLSTGSIE